MNALIIFIKNPVLGKVKTRLAKSVGDAEALAIYQKLLAITRQNALQLRGCARYLFYSDFIKDDDEWSNDDFIKNVQQGEDLGARMHHAFEYVFRHHSRACIIGSDCPTLTTTILNEAFQQLQTHAAVIGPSTDGGYYLLGFNKKDFQPAIFNDMQWSTDLVLPETQKRLAVNATSTAVLTSLTDIDEEEDWKNFVLTTK